MYHFLVESKPHERIDILITASVNIYQTKKEKSIPAVVKTLFSEGKLMKQCVPRPFLRESPLSTNPLFLSNFL